MNEHEANDVLNAAAVYDSRTVGPIEASAWAAALPDIDRTEALAAVVRHYADTTERIMPAHIRRVVARLRSERAESRAISHASPAGAEAHCGIKHCACTHDHGCFKGWIELDSGKTRPCPTCRPNLGTRVDSVPAPGQRNPEELARLRDPDAAPRWQDRSA